MKLFEDYIIPSIYKLIFGDVSTSDIALKKGAAHRLDVLGGDGTLRASLFGDEDSMSLGASRDSKLQAAGKGGLGFGGLDNGQVCAIKSLTELTSILAQATTDTTIEIPAGAIVLAVSARVTVVTATTASYDIGIAGATTRYATGIADTAGATAPGTDDAARYYASATKIRFTPNATPGDTLGRIRVTIHFILVTPPTS